MIRSNKKEFYPVKKWVAEGSVRGLFYLLTLFFLAALPFCDLLLHLF
jgi:hypothetical protein